MVDHGNESAGARVGELLEVVWQVPHRWIWLMVLCAVLASVDLTRAANGSLSFTVDVGPLAIVSVALIWLPALLRLLVLTGGTVKAGSIEASAQGLLSQDDLFELATRTKAVVVSAQGDEATRSVAIAELDATVDRVAQGALRPTESLHDALRPLTQQYERLRRDTPPGPQRTSAMTRLMNEARVRAAASPDVARSLALEFVGSTAPGERIIGLALVQEVVPKESFAQVLPLVPGSASAFEMYHALLALQELSSDLDDSQRQQAIRTLEAEQRDPRGLGLDQDPGLPSLLERTLTQLRSRGERG
jgi:hypothetical protein